ncbi:DNA internalization-related competence protein ComEC/Rec2 [Tumebacillus sp. ITR2]|uniref:DNA internalization-related competence protein ComEC/Rec2 n=1 Tax=Tumebacillus amylolyticus TaxID=2801339 RepID=A0ABS1JAN6_9BACL|nr:DNA internalization-related competence protein ComEC/Rec2 [Tumebacillus amylolyticus]MBL0387314.1 DNA internalization-related competence protein ComEC/Rec2 [Tumebacillus amylolyticus]
MTPRLILITVVCLAVGIFAGRWVPASLFPGWLALPVILSFFAAWRVRWGLWIAAVTVGLFTFGVHQWQQQPTLDTFVDKSVTLLGQVSEDPSGTSFILQLKEVDGKPVDEKAIVYAKTTPHYGDLLAFRATLEKPSPPRNPGGFDAYSYYTRQGINYSVSTDQYKTISHDDRGLRGRLLLPLRHRLLDVIRQNFKPEHAALVSGIVLGVEDDLDPEVKETFREMGVIHILVVSGSNISLLILPLLAILKKFRVETRKRYLFAIALIVLYGALAGGGPSVTRACTMTVIWCLSRLLSRQSDRLTSWALSGGILLLFDPFLLDNIGFQLTFLLTLALLVVPPHIERLLISLVPTPTNPEKKVWKVAHEPIRKLLNAFFLTVLAELISTPLVLIIGHVFTPLSLLANLYILPLIAVLLPTAAVSILLGLVHPALATIPAQITSWGLHLMVNPLTYASHRGWLVRHFEAPSPAWLWLYYGSWLLFFLKRTQKFALPAIACLLILGITWRTFSPQNLRITFLDVGQGDSILLELPNHQTWLVDGGGIPGFQHTTYDPGARVVVPALAAKGIDDIDTLVLTHADEDHVRGVAAALQTFRVHQLLVSDLTTDKPFYQNLLQEARRRQIPIKQVHAGQSLTPEPDLNISILNPPREPYVGTRSDSNANCIVFSLSYGKRNFLFTGDLEGEVEANLLPKLSHVDVLKVAHHGSGHSSTDPFLQKTTPAHAILSVGAHNSYGHPASATLERLRLSNAHIWRTDLQGAIVCETDGQNLDMYSWLVREYYPTYPPAAIGGGGTQLDRR